MSETIGQTEKKSRKNKVKELREQAMVVGMRIRCWTGRINYGDPEGVARAYDLTVSEASKSVQSYKVLVSMSTCEEYAKIRRAEADLRKLHYDYCAPWRDGGKRIIQAAKYKEYAEKVRKAKEEFAKAVDELKENFPKIKENARARMGKLYDEERDWPTLLQLDMLFGVELNFEEVPGDDFRVHLDAGELDEIRAEYRKKVEEQIGKSVSTGAYIIKARLEKLRDWALNTKTKHDADKLKVRLESLADDVSQAEVLNYGQDENLISIITATKAITALDSTQLGLLAQLSLEVINKVSSWWPDPKGVNDTGSMVDDQLTQV